MLNQTADLTTVAAQALLASLDKAIVAKLTELAMEKDTFNYAAKTIEDQS